MTEVVVVPNAEAIAAKVLARLEQIASTNKDLISMMLAGGSTPAPLHRALAAHEDWPWWRTVVGFGDERCVPPEHPDSNFRSARSHLLDAVRPAAVLRMPGEAPSPEQAAARYAELLEALPGRRATITFLGMGDDGHTASLFPGQPRVEDKDVIAVPEPGPGMHRRISVTDAFIARSDSVMVLVSGASKANRLAEVLAGTSDLPLTRVLRQRAGRPTLVFADQAAASALEGKTQ